MSENKQKEFWKNVSPQDQLPFAGSGRIHELDKINALLDILKSGTDIATLKNTIIENLLKDPELFHRLRLFVGIKNKRAYLDLSYICRSINKPNSQESICECKNDEFNAHQISFFINKLKENGQVSLKFAQVLTDYLFEKGLIDVLKIFSDLDNNKRGLIIKNTILPAELQQSDAKRRGHGAEGAFAKIVKELGCRLLPEDKAENPMNTGDIRLNKEDFTLTDSNNENTRSYDSIIMDDDGNIRVVVIGLIHSSDPGEYGVAKAHRTRDYKKEVDTYNSRISDSKKILLCCLVDGTGFAENKKDTINIVLENVDYFVQIKTLYKIGLLLHKLGLCKIKGIKLNTTFYSTQEIEYIKKEYISSDIIYIDDERKIDPKWKKIEAGLGDLFI